MLYMQVYMLLHHIIMTFRKNNKDRYTTNREKPLTSSPVCFRLDGDTAKELKSIHNWQEKLRKELSLLITKWKAQ